MIRLYVVGCGAAKADGQRPVRELYIGPLFRAARDHVEATGGPWWVLSAGLGLVWPHRLSSPYDLTVDQLRKDIDTYRQRTLLAAGAFGQSLCLGEIGRTLGWPDAATVEVHAGAAYVEWFREIVSRAPLTTHHHKPLAVTIEDPLHGLQIGERLHWYAERRSLRYAALTPETP